MCCCSMGGGGIGANSLGGRVVAVQQTTVTMVRIYLSEEKAHLEQLLKQLQEVEQLRGVTVFRGISGFGSGGEVHSAGLLDLSLNLPIVVEFFDTPQKVKKVLEDLVETVDPAHIVSWDAKQIITELKS